MRKISLLFLMVFFSISFSEGATVKKDEFLNFDKTLRLNYIFSGNVSHTEVSLYSLASYDGWWGRRVNLDRVVTKGNGQVIVCDPNTDKIFYINSFSTLYSEWLTTQEAKSVTKSFENVFLVPMPANRAKVIVRLFGADGEVLTEFSHIVDPYDILIKPYKTIEDKEIVGNYQINDTQVRYLHKGGQSKDCIDVVVVAEGYSEDQMEDFFTDASLSVDEILNYEPFKSYKDKFNFVAVGAISNQSGVSIPGQGIWLSTALSSHFDTFYMDRYLTTLSLYRLHDIISIVPYEHIIILANTSNYGGGGIYNSYVLSASKNRWHKPVVVHEFGHSFGALADEYFYDDQMMNSYKQGVEPWEGNITTLTDFEAKWKDMVKPTTPIVTKEMQPKDYLKNLTPKDYVVGLYEGGGYQSKGVYRPYPTCRMRDNTYPTFCPVCERLITKIINYNTIENKD